MGAEMPKQVEPMYAVSGTLPVDIDRYGLEVKWDGIRAIAYVDEGVRLTGRRGTDFTNRYPELASLTGRLTGHAAILDGEIVALDRYGRPSFERLQRRMHVTDPAWRGLVREVPVRYLVFDLLYLDGQPLLDAPYARRRELLESLTLSQPAQVPPYFTPDHAADLLEATREQGLEGVVAKRLDSPYRPGRRVDWWRKVKHLRSQEVIIAGWKPGQGRRAGGIGSLLLGVYQPRGLTYAGHVGTGFTEAMLTDLGALLAPLETDRSPFVDIDEVPREYVRGAHWVQPRLIGEVVYTEWTKEGRLRNPAWRGLRADKRPEEVTREG